MPQRSGLGKGLDALIPGSGTVSSDGGTAQVAVIRSSAILVNRANLLRKMNSKNW